MVEKQNLNDFEKSNIQIDEINEKVIIESPEHNNEVTKKKIYFTNQTNNKQTRSLELHFESLYTNLKINETFTHEITCLYYPRNNDLKEFSNQGGNVVVTLLHDGEKHENISTYCKKNNLLYFHIPMKGANISILQQQKTLKILLENLMKLINFIKESQTKLKILVHCAAGIHRTGTILYCLLRIFGADQEQAMSKIKAIRIHTFRDVGNHRIEFSEKLLVSGLKLMMAYSEENSNKMKDINEMNELIKMFEIDTKKKREKDKDKEKIKIRTNGEKNIEIKHINNNRKFEEYKENKTKVKKEILDLDDCITNFFS